MTVWIDNVELLKGRVIEYSGATLPDGVMVAATNDKGELLVFDEYKYAHHKVMTLVPAGGIDVGEDPVAAAKRELLEETGYTGDTFEIIGKTTPYPSKINQTSTIVRVRVFIRLPKLAMNRLRILRIFGLCRHENFGRYSRTEIFSLHRLLQLSLWQRQNFLCLLTASDKVSDGLFDIVCWSPIC